METTYTVDELTRMLPLTRRDLMQAVWHGGLPVKAGDRGWEVAQEDLVRWFERNDVSSWAGRSPLIGEERNGTTWQGPLLANASAPSTPGGGYTSSSLGEMWLHAAVSIQQGLAQLDPGSQPKLSEPMRRLLQECWETARTVRVTFWDNSTFTGRVVQIGSTQFAMEGGGGQLLVPLDHLAVLEFSDEENVRAL